MQRKIYPLILFGLLSVGCSKMFAQAPNNECATAINIPLGAEPVISNTTGATNNVSDPVPACWLTAPSSTVWFTFTALNTGPHTITTDNGTGIYETDTQVALYSGSCGSLTQIACSEDNGTMSNTLAGQVTANLNAGAIYFVMVDVYGTGAGESFAINVSHNTAPINDCIFNAVDLTTAANGLGINGASCASYYFNAPGNAAADGPTEDVLVGDANSCNGVDLLGNPIPDHQDIWFFVDITAATPGFWVSAFQDAGAGPNYCMAVYQGTPTGTCGSAGALNGLTYIDCSNGDVIYLPPGNEHGGARDKGVCTTPLHPRLDLTGLPAGRYYVRLWEAFGGAPSDGIVRLCLESATRSAGVFDLCPNLTYTPCTNPNVDYQVAFVDLANVAVGGNSCNTATGEPQLAAGVPSDFDDGCLGTWVTGVGYVNNVMNNSLIIPFIVDAIGPCDARVELEFSNVSMEGTRGKVAQIQVMNAPCEGGSSSVMNVSTEKGCIKLRPSGNGTLPAGIYYIVMDGQDGNLVRFDLNINVTYSGLDCSAAACGPLADKEIIALASLKEDEVEVEWQVQGMDALSRMELQRSNDMGATYQPLYTLNPEIPFSPEAHYTWNDIMPQPGTNYYRIVAHDPYGAQVMSSVMEVLYSGEQSFVGKVYPNPTQGGAKALLDLHMAGAVDVNIYDLRGLLLTHRSFEAPEGRSTLPIPIEGLAKGSVIVTIQADGNKKEQLLIIH